MWLTNTLRIIGLMVLVGLYGGCNLHLADAQPTAKPQCLSLDGLIEHITRSMQSLPATAVICAKIPGCLGIRCSINILGQNLGISLRMYPCASLPQMRIRIFIPSSGINFSQMITHGTTIALPGFQYSPLPGIRIQAQMAVNFQAVPEGLLIGMWFQARGFGTGISWPIVPDYTIFFPPCTGGSATTAPPPLSQCGIMETLVISLPPPPGFTCSVFPDCLGFHCFGSVDAVILTYAVNVSLTINHCDVPVSYSVALTNPGSPLLWQHTFYRNDTVPISNFPGGATASLQVLMRPYPDAGYIDTSIKVIVCMGTVGCFDLSFMSNKRVPVPPCTSNAPPPILEYLHPDLQHQVTSPECLAWQRVENSLKNMNVPGLRVSYCYIEAPVCNHIMCTAHYNGQTPPATSTSYSIYLEVKHCTRPMTMLFSVRGLNNNFVMEERINANTNDPLTTVNGVLLNIHFRELTEAIQLSVSVLVPVGGGAIPPVSLPLINNQYIPLPKCSSAPGGGGTGTNPVYPTENSPWQPGPQGITQKPFATNPKNNRVPNGKAEDKNSAVPLALGLLFTSLVVIGGIFGAIYWYRRRRPAPTEQTGLVDEVEHDTVRFSIGS